MAPLPFGPSTTTDNTTATPNSTTTTESNPRNVRFAGLSTPNSMSQGVRFAATPTQVSGVADRGEIGGGGVRFSSNIATRVSTPAANTNTKTTGVRFAAPTPETGQRLAFAGHTPLPSRGNLPATPETPQEQVHVIESEGGGVTPNSRFYQEESPDGTKNAAEAPPPRKSSLFRTTLFDLPPTPEEKQTNDAASPEPVMVEDAAAPQTQQAARHATSSWHESWIVVCGLPPNHQGHLPDALSSLGGVQVTQTLYHPHANWMAVGYATPSQAQRILSTTTNSGFLLCNRDLVGIQRLTPDMVEMLGMVHNSQSDRVFFANYEEEEEHILLAEQEVLLKRRGGGVGSGGNLMELLLSWFFMW